MTPALRDLLGATRKGLRQSPGWISQSSSFLWLCLIEIAGYDYTNPNISARLFYATVSRHGRLTSSRAQQGLQLPVRFRILLLRGACGPPALNQSVSSRIKMTIIIVECGCLYILITLLPVIDQSLTASLLIELRYLSPSGTYVALEACLGIAPAINKRFERSNVATGKCAARTHL